jgi:16S rRNA G966 N2-methylase RsmD
MAEIIQIIEDQLKTSIGNLIITDATSNVGGSAINFAIWSKYVNVVEINPKVCEILKNNINVYKLNHKVNIFCDDYTKIMSTLVQDIIFIDPPWGGLDYKSHKSIDLKLGEYDISEVCNLLKNKTKLIILKVPTNFNFIKFEQKIKFNNISKYNYKNVDLISLS